MSSKSLRIALAITGGWTVLSLGVIAWDAIGGPASTVNRASHRGISVKPPVDPDPEIEAMKYRFYPTRLSQGWEEMFIRDYFEERRGGVFVDVGANHHRNRSTTHFLDVALGWTGLAIDPIADFAPGYAEHRPGTKFIPLFVGETSDEDVEFFFVKRNSRLSTADVKLAEKLGGFSKREVRTTSLNDLLAAHAIESVDLLKMDIELWEPAALRGFDIDRFKPQLVVVEMHPEVAAEVDAYMAGHGYENIPEFSENDELNGYYVPLGDREKYRARSRVGTRLSPRP